MCETAVLNFLMVKANLKDRYANNNHEVVPTLPWSSQSPD